METITYRLLTSSRNFHNGWLKLLEKCRYSFFLLLLIPLILLPPEYATVKSLQRFFSSFVNALILAILISFHLFPSIYSSEQCSESIRHHSLIHRHHSADHCHHINHDDGVSLFCAPNSFIDQKEILNNVFSIKK